MSFKNIALPLAALGIPVVPVHPMGKQCTLENWPLLATTDANQIKAWDKENPRYNVGLVMQPSGFCVLEFDIPDGVQRVEKETGQQMPATRVHKSGSGFAHVIFRQTEVSKLLGNRSCKDSGHEMFSFRQSNRYVVGPGSTHPNGNQYGVLSDAPIADFPDWLAPWIDRYTQPEVKKSDGNLRVVSEDFDFEEFTEHYGIGGHQSGDWYVTDVCPIAQHKHEHSRRTGFYWDGSSIGFHCFAGGCAGSSMNFGQALKALNDRMIEAGGEPYRGVIWEAAELDPSMVEMIAPEQSVEQGVNEDYEEADIEQATWDEDRYPLNDMGNKNRLVDLFGRRFKYVDIAKKWHYWTKKRWAEDDSRGINRAAEMVVKAIEIEARTEGEKVKEMMRAAGDDEAKKEAVKDSPEYKRWKSLTAWAHQCGERNRIDNMISLARADLAFAARKKDFDKNDWLLNVENGTLDLRTGGLQRHSPKDMITRLCPVKYDPEAKSELWDAFLAKVQPSQAVRDYLMRGAGYSATGDTSEQCLFLLEGAGANGKTVFLEVVRHVIGDYSRTASMATFLERNEGVPNDVAALAGARFVTASESGQSKRFAEEKIKQLTGGDTVSCRFLYQEFFEYTPQMKLWIATNHKPNVQGTDDGIWRRIRRIKWGVQIPPEQQDRHLAAKLKQEGSGILNWMLKGLGDWRTFGLMEPPEVLDSTHEYRAGEDIIQMFLDDTYDLKPAAKAPARDLYDNYKFWCERNSERPLKQKEFSEELQRRGFELGRGSAGRFYRGLSRKAVNYSTPQVLKEGEAL